MWINIIMDGPPAQSLGVEPVDERILRAPPRKVNDPIVTRALLTRAVSSAALIMFLTLKVFAHELGEDSLDGLLHLIPFIPLRCMLLFIYRLILYFLPMNVLR